MARRCASELPVAGTMHGRPLSFPKVIGPATATPSLRIRIHTSPSPRSLLRIQALKGDPNTKRIAKVIADGPVQAFRLTRKSVAELFGDLGELIKRNVQLKLLPTIEIFQRLSEAEIAVLVDSSIDENFKAGDTIMRQGDKKSRVYVIKDGKVNLTAGRNEELGTGDYFGEEAFESSDAEYSCTVVAADATTLLSIDCNQFKNSATVQIADALRTAMASAPPNARKSQRVAAMPEMSDLNVTTLIGVGSFGRVRLALDERAGEYYALKCMNKV